MDFEGVVNKSLNIENFKSACKEGSYFCLYFFAE